MKKKFHFPILLFLFLFIGMETKAQIGFDENALAVNSAGTVNTLMFTAPAGTDRLLVVTIGTDDITNAATVTFNGETLTLGGEDVDNHNDTYDSRVLVYYLALGTGPAITSTIEVTVLQNHYNIGAMTFTGIDQINPKKQASQAGEPINDDDLLPDYVHAEINGVVEDNLLFAFFGEDNVQQFNWGGTYIKEGTHATTGLDGAGYYYASYNKEAASGSHTFGYDINNGGQTCAGVVIEFSKVPPPTTMADCDGVKIMVTPSSHTTFVANHQNQSGIFPDTLTMAASDSIIGSAIIEAFDSGVKPAIIFQAKNAIVLKPGFHAVAGSGFIAKIDDCNTNFTSDQPADSRLARLTNDNSIAADIELSVYPNPATYAFSIQLDLPETGILSIDLLSQSGQIIKRIAQSNHQEKGTYYYHIDTGNLARGFYLVQMHNGKERITKKLIIQ